MRNNESFVFKNDVIEFLFRGFAMLGNEFFNLPHVHFSRLLFDVLNHHFAFHVVHFRKTIDFILV